MSGTSRHTAGAALNRIFTLAAALALLAGSASAGPLNLAQSPLFLGTAVPPNILLLVDDSGSMDWNIIVPANGTDGIISGYTGSPTDEVSGNNVTVNFDYAYLFDDANNNSGPTGNDIPIPLEEMFINNGTNTNYRSATQCTAAQQTAYQNAGLAQGYWRLWNSAYNGMAYNPATTYTPWAGVDDAGVPFANATPTSVRLDAYTSTSATINLTSNIRHRTQYVYQCGGSGTFYRKLMTGTGTGGPQDQLSLYPARYYTWTDSNSNGVMDASDTHQLVEIRTSGSPTPGNGAVCAGGACSAAAAAELQNYANWYQYYRRRILTAAAAYSNVVDGTGSINNRMGLVTLHNNSGFNNIAIRLMNSSNKSSLLEAIDGLSANLGTPLQQEMNNAYRYLECTNTANTYGLTHDTAGNIDDNGDGTGTMATLASGCPALNVAHGGECQRNFLIAQTDGYYNSNPANIVEETAGGTTNVSRDSFNADADNSSPDATGNSIWDAGQFGDSYGGTLADLSMYWYEHDIQPNLANKLRPIAGVDDNTAQHVVTYTVALGLNGTLTDATSPPTVTTNPFPWPNPQSGLASSIPEKIDDLRHAAFNGRGKFVSAKNPQALSDALTKAINDAAKQSSSASAAALNSSSLNNGSSIYQAIFTSPDWTGDLQARPISNGPGTPGCSVEPVGQPCPVSWKATTVLPAPAARQIITVDTGTKGGIPFRWASLPAAQQTPLNYNADTGSFDTFGQWRLDWLRGIDNPTGVGAPPAGTFRTRTTPLGDIVDSSPFYVGAPKLPYDSFAGYTSFRISNMSRTPMVYVGANDGMLHGFRASDGQELIAFVPGVSDIYANLPRLTAQNYTTNHRNFVDASPIVADAQDSGGTWKSVLVGGLRSGGRGIYALDVTDPSLFTSGETNAASIFMWQFTELDDADLGYTYGKPAIAKMANNKWAVIIGNGYNSGGTGQSCVFALFVDGPGADKTWDPGTDYFKKCTGQGNSGTPNGMASPAAVDVNGDFVADSLYAGDQLGYLWRFDVSDALVTNWNLAYSPNALFRACAGGNCTPGAGTGPQPITTRPEVGEHPKGRPSENGVLVFFGTGQYLAAGDNNSGGQNTQTFYMVYDQMWGLDKTKTANATKTPTAPPALPIPLNRLVQQSILAESKGDGTACATDNTGPCFRTVSNIPVTLTKADGTVNGVPINQGWYLDLLNTGGGNTNNFGERNVTDSVLRTDTIVFTTLIPSSSPCDAGGTGWLMELKFDSGGEPPKPAFDISGPTPGTPDGKVDSRDTIGGDNPGGTRSTVGILPSPGIEALGGGGGGGGGGGPRPPCLEVKYLPGTNSLIQTVVESCSYETGRLNWRQIR